MLGDMRRTFAPALAALALALAACGGGSEPNAAPPSNSPAQWTEREPVIYSVVVAEVLDDVGTSPPVVYVVDSTCAEAGQVEPSDLECGAAFPATGRDALVEQLQRYAQVEFVATPDEAVDGSGAVRGDGLLFWFGPLKDRKNGEVRVGANYTAELTDERSGGVNLALENQGMSWVVTGAAGLGGCPA
jgi:hypothetical protein